MREEKKRKILYIGSWVRVPEDFVEKWGGEFGCPVYDSEHNFLGYCAKQPMSISEEEEALDTFMEC